MRVPITLDPNYKCSVFELSDDNNTLTIPIVKGMRGFVRATNGVSKGKWYWECTPLYTINNTDRLSFSIVTKDATDKDTSAYPINNTSVTVIENQLKTGDGVGYGSYNSGVVMFTKNITPDDTYGYVRDVGTFKLNDTIRLLLNMDNNKITFYKNDIKIHEVGNLPNNSTIYPAIFNYCWDQSDTIMKASINFGATPFKYPVPAGYKPYDSSQKKNLYLKSKTVYGIKAVG